MDDDLDLDLQSAAVQPEIESQNSDKNPKWVCPEVKCLNITDASYSINLN